MTLEDHLRDMPLAKQVEALRSYLLWAEKERDEARTVARHFWNDWVTDERWRSLCLADHPWLKQEGD